MAKSTYISTHLTDDQISFLRLLDENEIIYFSLNDIVSRLGIQVSNINELAENLYHKGILDRVELGTYTRSQYHDPFVLGSFISQGGVVGYWSALHLHGLTERFPNTVFIKTIHRKRSDFLFGTKVQFVTVLPRKMVGKTWEGYGDKRYPLTGKEATLLDCFDQPRYGGDWPDVIRAFHRAVLDAEKLTQYAKAYNNLSVIKRMGYLASLFEKKELQPFVEYALMQVRQKYTLFEPGGPGEGTHNTQWKLRMNVSEEAILDIVEDPY